MAERRAGGPDDRREQAPPVARGATRRDRWASSVALGCGGSLLAAGVTAVLAVAVLATALHGCAPDFGSPPAAQIGVTRSKGGDIIVVVPPCAPKVTVISLYVLTGTKALWQAKSTKPRKVQYAVLGTPPLDFATKDAPPHLPVPTARLRLKVTFGSPVTDTTTTGSTTTTTTTTVTAAAGASTPGTAAPGDAAPTDTNEISSEVLFRQNQLAQGRVLLDDELVTVEQFTKRTCKKTPR